MTIFLIFLYYIYDRKKEMFMISLKHGYDEEFLDSICTELQSGKKVLVEMYGYHMYVYPDTSRNSIRLAIMQRLKDIRCQAENIRAIEELNIFDDVEMDYIKKQTPDVIARVLFEHTHYPDIETHSLR